MKRQLLYLVGSTLLGLGIISLVMPFALEWFIHGDYDRYIWIINGPYPFSYWGSGPVQLGLIFGCVLSGLILLAIGTTIVIRQRNEKQSTATDSIKQEIS